jgi:hypothetical protein
LLHEETKRERERERDRERKRVPLREYRSSQVLRETLFGASDKMGAFPYKINADYIMIHEAE